MAQRRTIATKSPRTQNPSAQAPHEPRNLELIGEAATHIPTEIRAAHPEVPWRLIIATRNRVVHAYLGIDNDTIWSIVQDDLQPLLAMLERLKALYSR